MNFLAHLWLADRAAACMGGAILGDLVRGRVAIAAAEARPTLDSLTDSAPAQVRDPAWDPLRNQFPAALARSILLHRRIDVTTDRHPLVRAAVQGFDIVSRRHAGILLDLLYDHLLARDWCRFGEESLPDFAARAALEVAAAAPWFEQIGRRAPDAARFRDLLLSYLQTDGIDLAIERTATRLRNPEKLLAAADGWRRRVDGLAADLPPLLADLLEAARQFMRDPRAGASPIH